MSEARICDLKRDKRWSIDEPLPVAVKDIVSRRQHRPPGHPEGAWTPVRVWKVARLTTRSTRRAHPHHRLLRFALVFGGALVFLASGGALALGGKRIVAEEAAFSGPAAPGCVPATLDRSDLLPGTALRVSPLPDSLDATPHTQISLLGVPRSRLAQITVSGSATGGHPGRVVAYSQGDGASFVPSNPFQPGETVTVRGKLLARGHWQPFAFRFTISVPDPIPWEPPGHEPAGTAAEVQHYHSAPSLEPPSIQVTTGSGPSPAGDIFSAPYSGPGGNGPMILDGAGQLVWFDSLPRGVFATNLQVQSDEGQPVLTWWQGHIPKQGFGEGEEVIANSSYKQIAHVHAGNGLKADLHDFHVNANGTALTTVFNPIHCNLSGIGGPQDSAVNDSVFQEIDLRTGLVRREWTSLDHVALSESYSTPYGANTEWPYDFFHMNSLDQEPDGAMLISARNTWALYQLDEQTGQVLTRAGGKHSTIKMGSGTLTAFQHDATLLPDGEISVFDNGGVPTVHPQSRGIVVALDAHTGTETLVAEYEHPSTALKAGSQGNVQELPSGNLFIGWGAESWFSEFRLLGSAGVRRADAARRPKLPRLPLPVDGHPHGSAGDCREREQLLESGDGVRELERGHGGRLVESLGRALHQPARPRGHRRARRLRDGDRHPGAGALRAGAGSQCLGRGVGDLVGYQVVGRPLGGAILRPRSLVCQAHFAHCVLVSLAQRTS